MDVESALNRACGALLSRRNSSGYWEGRLASSPLATAVALAALGDSEIPAAKVSSGFEYLINTQNPDGGWGDTEISRSNLAATLLALSADAVQSAKSGRPFIHDGARVAASAYVEKLGGLHRGLRNVYGRDLTFQVPIRMTAAFAGQLPWHKVDALPFELALAPRSIMGALRLPVVSYALPALVSVGLARHSKAPSWMLPLRWLREKITDHALEAILKMQPQSGGYLEAIPITAFCLIGLKSAGRESHPVAQNAKRFLIETQREDGSWPVEVNLSVWNTTRAIDVLACGGLLERLSQTERDTTRDWLLAQQCRGVSVYSDAQPGGWGWNHLPGSVPDADDTAGAIIALRHLGVPANHPALVTGKKWLRELRNRNGGWPTFCRGWEKLPFDRSAPDLTAHAIRALTSSGMRDDKIFTPGWDYLRGAQHADGSFAPLWFGCESAKDSANSTYGTAQVVFACQTPSYEEWCNRPREDEESTPDLHEKAMDWLVSAQNTDGSFGGCKGVPGSAEETGLALRALVDGGVEPKEDVCQSAARWLMENQLPDGSWKPAPIGFYFAVLWYYEDLYPLCYALGGLGSLWQGMNAPRQDIEEPDEPGAEQTEPYFHRMGDG